MTLVAMTAVFSDPWTVTVLGAGAGSGVVESQGANPSVDCTVAAGSTSGTCTGTYLDGATVTLVATPSAGSVVSGWSGACSGTGTCEVTMSQARNVTAEFVIQTFGITLTVQIVNGDSGFDTVAPSPPGGTILVDKLGGPGPSPIQETYTFNEVVTGACDDSVPGNAGGDGVMPGRHRR